MSVEIEHNLGCFDVLTDAPYHGCHYTHHIAMLYLVSVSGQEKKGVEVFVQGQEEREENDSLGFTWVKPEKFHSGNASPLVLKACELLEKRETFDMIPFKAKNSADKDLLSSRQEPSEADHMGG